MKVIMRISLLAMGIGATALMLSNLTEKVRFNTVFSDLAHAQETTRAFEQVILHIEGMTCRKCVKPLQKALLEIPGVRSSQVSYSDAEAVVECEKGKVTDEQLVKAIENQSGFFYTYTASVTSRK